MKIEICEDGTNLVNIFSEHDGIKKEKSITLDDFIESLMSAKNKNIFKPIASPIYKDEYGSKLIQCKTIGKNSCIYILLKERAKMPFQLFKRIYDNVGYPNMLFAIKVVNDKVSSLCLVCTKTTKITVDTKLYKYPFTNVSGNEGRVCLGSNGIAYKISKKNNLYKVPIHFCELPNTLHGFNQRNNSKLYDCEEMVKYLSGKDFEDKLLVLKNELTTYKEWFEYLK